MREDGKVLCSTMVSENDFFEDPSIKKREDFEKIEFKIDALPQEHDLQLIDRLN